MSSPTNQPVANVEQFVSTLQPLLTRLTAAGAPGPVSASGTYETVIAATLLDASVVSDALPDGLRAVPDPFTPLGKHPILLTLGTQYNVTVKDVAGSITYDEAIVAIPNVAVQGFEEKGLALYPSRIEVDDWKAWLLGKLIGLPKDLCVIDSTAQIEGLYTAETLYTRETILQAHTRTMREGPSKPKDFPNFKYVAEMMKQPVVSQDAFGNFLFCVFEWAFDTAQLHGTVVELTVDEDLPALPAGRYEFYGFGKESLGSGRLDVQWDICGPFATWPPSSAS
jgi:hypothetical protein